MNYRRLFRFQIALVMAPVAGLMPLLVMPLQAQEKEFSPILEADMPAGFPQYTPVGDIQIKRYPAYRKAEADAKSRRAFWTLFSHIKKNDIAMTAPVEMAYSDREGPSESTMAFLYGRADMGRPGRQARVEVIDVAPMLVVSTGVRGSRTPDSVAKARARLEVWLDANQRPVLSKRPIACDGIQQPLRSSKSQLLRGRDSDSFP